MKSTKGIAVKLTTITLVAVAITLAVAPSTGVAQERQATDQEGQATEASENRFDVRLEPYFWVPLIISGDITVRDQVRDFDANIGDVLDSLKFGAQMRAELWTGPMGFIFDGTYMRLGSSGPRDQGDVTTTQMVGDFFAGLRLFREHKVSLELLAGARVAGVEAEIEAPERTASAKRWSAAGLASVRVPIRLGQRWTLAMRGLVKAPVWDHRVEGVFEAKLATHMLATFGYRYSKMRYDKGPVEVDLSAHGPYLGLAFEW